MQAYEGEQTSVEHLPFEVRVARADELMAVAQMRASAYGRHLPAVGAQLVRPEMADYEMGCEVFVAVSRFDNSLLGTLRTHTNLLRPLPLEASIRLPDEYQGKRMVEATRLSVPGGSQASLVRNALFKAFFLYAAAQDLDWMVVTGRRPVDRIYDSLLYTDVAGPGAFYEMEHVGGVPHRVMSMAVAEAEPIWRRAAHPLYKFAFVTRHVDIDISGARDLAAARQTLKQQGQPGAAAMFRPTLTLAN
ncbi:MAG TPA: hypothetical protein VGE47_03060 [Burkholderiaceae bacterium]